MKNLLFILSLLLFGCGVSQQENIDTQYRVKPILHTDTYQLRVIKTKDKSLSEGKTQYTFVFTDTSYINVTVAQYHMYEERDTVWYYVSKSGKWNMVAKPDSIP